MTVHPITIRICTTMKDFDACAVLQQRVWGFSELETTPSHIFMVAVRTGGLVLLASEGRRPVGFASGFAAMREGRAFFHSDMVGVLPQYQNRGIGRMLKLKQREEMLRRGCELIEWTFDPLALRNALLNITRLGIVSRRYIPNAYGSTSSPLHANLPTDRLVAEWWLRSERVEKILSRQNQSLSPQAVRISIPSDIAELRQRNVRKAKQVQSVMRRQFLHYFEQGFTVTGFELSGSFGTYLLEPGTNVH